MTKPLAEYTEASLLSDMVNPSRLVGEKELKEIFRGEIGLGTQATRAQIIETLLMRKYVQRKKKGLLALPKGMILIENLRKLKFSKVLTNPKETAKWELALEEIAQGSGDPRAFMLRTRKFITDCTAEWKAASIENIKKTPNDTLREPAIGNCPLCQNKVIDSPKSYSCKQWRAGCKFKIWKKIAGKKISATQAKKMLENGKSDHLKGFKSKAGKSFDAVLELKRDNVNFVFQ